jgi:hypothetical protein
MITVILKVIALVCLSNQGCVYFRSASRMLLKCVHAFLIDN